MDNITIDFFDGICYTEKAVNTSFGLRLLLFTLVMM